MPKLNIRIKELRKEKNLSTKDFGQIFNVTERTAQRWETGERVPSVDLLIQFAKFFDVSLDYLVGLED